MKSVVSRIKTEISLFRSEAARIADEVFHQPGHIVSTISATYLNTIRRIIKEIFENYSTPQKALHSLKTSIQSAVSEMERESVELKNKISDAVNGRSFFGFEKNFCSHSSCQR